MLILATHVRTFLKYSILDFVAIKAGVWALRHLYGADCETDVRDDFPDDPVLQCISCDAKRLVNAMLEIE